LEALRDEGSITARAAEELRRAILRGDLQPGTLYAVHTVAKELGVSRTPAREALIKLAAEGMIRFERNRGFIVRHAAAQDLQEIFTLRLLLEVPATSAAAQLATAADVRVLEEHIESMRHEKDTDDAESFLAADRGFHRSLLLIGHNVRLAEFVDGLRNVVLMSGVSTANRSESISDILDPHVEILEHVRRRDPEAAAESMRVHLLDTGRRLLRQQFGDGAVAAFDQQLRLMGRGAAVSKPAASQ
jgi:DNA-binding GntR family transcriptional regulator